MRRGGVFGIVPFLLTIHYKYNIELSELYTRPTELSRGKAVKRRRRRIGRGERLYCSTKKALDSFYGLVVEWVHPKGRSGSNDTGTSSSAGESVQSRGASLAWFQRESSWLVAIKMDPFGGSLLRDS